MKKTLVIAALALAASPAFASKARKNSLLMSAHLDDAQDVLSQPYDAGTMGEWATFEFGSAGGATTNAEAGFVRKSGDSAWGMYFGNKSETFKTFTDAARTAGGFTNAESAKVFTQDNPLNLFYSAKSGDMTWGAGFYYVATDRKPATGDIDAGAGTFNAVNSKTNIMGLNFGATNGQWDADVTLGLSAQSSFEGGAGTTTVAVGDKVDLKGKTNIVLNGGYRMDSLYYYGTYGMSGAKLAVAGTDSADMDGSVMGFGVTNSHKKDGTDFYYGAQYGMTTVKEKIGDTKTDSSSLTAYAGIEADAASWLVLRASASQRVLIDSTKETTGGTGEATTSDSTKVAAGLGMKWNKWMFDGFVANSFTNGGAFGLDANFVTQGSLTYNF